MAGKTKGTEWRLRPVLFVVMVQSEPFAVVLLELHVGDIVLG